MITLARFISKGPGQAALVAATMAILGLIFMPASWLSAAAIALVVLVQGPSAGARVTLYAIIGSALLLLLTTGRPELTLFFVMLIWLPVWLPAMVLRQTVSLAYALLLVTAIALAGCLAFYGVLPGFEKEYEEVITAAMRQLVSQYQLELTEENFSGFTELVIKLLPGLFISSLMVGSALGLMLARWWQAVLVNPGGFGSEFQSLRLGKSSALIACVIVLAAAQVQSDLLIAMSMVVTTLYLIQGTSLLHALVKGLKLNGAWLFGVYVLVFFVPHVIALMVMAGIIDAFVDFRRRLIPSGDPD